MKKLAVAACAFFVFTQGASAFDVAPVAGARVDSFSTDNPSISFSSGVGYQLGGLLFLQVTPLLYLRTGVIYKNRTATESIPSVANFGAKITDNILDFPMDLEVDFPLGAYVYGGIIYSSTQSTSCNVTSGPFSSCTIASKTEDDMPLNVGLGYYLLNTALLKFGVEAEYQYGTRNLSNTGPYSLWFRGYSFDAILRLTL